jgi:hypothetical protein
MIEVQDDAGSLWVLRLKRLSSTEMSLARRDDESEGILSFNSETRVSRKAWDPWPESKLGRMTWIWSVESSLDEDIVREEVDQKANLRLKVQVSL